MKRFLVTLFSFAILSVLSLAVPPTPARATITATSGTDTVSPADPGTWSGTTTGYIGNIAAGSLTVDGGSDLLSGAGNIGYAAGVAGSVTVDGAGSSWVNSSSLTVGVYGSGALKIVNGGSVTSSTSYFGYGITSSGTATVDGSGSTWTVYSNPGFFAFYVGFGGNGTLNITNGGTVTVVSQNGYSTIGSVNNGRDENGMPINGPVTPNTVTVDGHGSTWVNDGTLRLGEGGSAILNITNGGTVTSRISSIGYSKFLNWWKSTATVDGAGSTWTTTLNMNIGVRGFGTLRIVNGGAVSDGNGIIGLESGSKGTVTVNGAGSRWTNNNGLNVGSGGTGTLAISGGGVVTTPIIGIFGASLLAIDVGRGSSLVGGTVSSSGAIRVLAGAGVAAGSSWSPISAGTWDGTGIYQAVGGTWSTGTHEFTVSDVQAGTAGGSVTLDLAQKQRILVGDGPSGWALGGSFLTKTSPSPLTFTGTPITDGPLTALDSLLDPGDGVLGGWALSATGGYATGDPAYLSFGVGPAQSLDDLLVWQYAGGSWSKYDAIDLTYDTNYASFTVTGMGTYAVTGLAVPEPAAIVLLGVGAGGWLARVWRRRR